LRALAGFDFLPANEPEDLWFARRYRVGNQPRPIKIRVELSDGFFFEARINLYFGAMKPIGSNSARSSSEFQTLPYCFSSASRAAAAWLSSAMRWRLIVSVFVDFHFVGCFVLLVVIEQT